MTESEPHRSETRDLIPFRLDTRTWFAISLRTFVP